MAIAFSFIMVDTKKSNKLITIKEKNIKCRRKFGAVVLRESRKRF